MSNTSYTRKEHEEFLNNLEFPLEDFTIRGIDREEYFPDKYGTLLRNIDVISFEKSYHKETLVRGKNEK